MAVLGLMTMGTSAWAAPEPSGGADSNAEASDPATVNSEPTETLDSPSREVLEEQKKTLVAEGEAEAAKAEAEAAKERADDAEAEAKQAKQALESARAGKLIRYGVTGGTALTTYFPLHMEQGDEGPRFYSTPGVGAMPYIMFNPAYWTEKPQVNIYCANKYAGPSSIAAAQIAADESAKARAKRRMVRLLEVVVADPGWSPPTSLNIRADRQTLQKIEKLYDELLAISNAVEGTRPKRVRAAKQAEQDAADKATLATKAAAAKDAADELAEDASAALQAADAAGKPAAEKKAAEAKRTAERAAATAKTAKEEAEKAAKAAEVAKVAAEVTVWGEDPPADCECEDPWKKAAKLLAEIDEKLEAKRNGVLRHGDGRRMRGPSPKDRKLLISDPLASALGRLRTESTVEAMLVRAGGLLSPSPNTYDELDGLTLDQLETAKRIAAAKAKGESKVELEVDGEPISYAIDDAEEMLAGSMQSTVVGWYEDLPANCMSRTFGMWVGYPLTFKSTLPVESSPGDLERTRLGVTGVTALGLGITPNAYVSILLGVGFGLANVSGDNDDELVVSFVLGLGGNLDLLTLIRG